MAPINKALVIGNTKKTQEIRVNLCYQQKKKNAWGSSFCLYYRENRNAIEKISRWYRFNALRYQEVVMILVTYRDAEKIAAMFSRAFLSDPLFVHLFPDDNTRRKSSYYTFRFIVRYAIAKGYVYATSEELEGAASWLLSEMIDLSLWDQLKYGGLAMLSNQSSNSIKRQMSVSAYMTRIHHQIVSEKHLYLSTIGVESIHQGKGFGSELVTSMLQGKQGSGLKCYLDTHCEKNMLLYKKLGFRVVHKAPIPDSEVYHWAMLRS